MSYDKEQYNKFITKTNKWLKKKQLENMIRKQENIPIILDYL